MATHHHLDPTITTPTFSLTISPSSTIHPTGIPSSPLYFLPTSLSTHSITLFINRYTPTTLTTRSRDTLHEHKLFAITKIPTTDTYTFVSHVPGRSGKGIIRYTSGWLWGGSWEAEFSFFDESLDKERRLILTYPGGPGAKWMLSEAEVVPGPVTEDGKMGPSTVGELRPETLVAEEQSNKHPATEEEAGAERGETILIHTGKQEVTDIVRELITVAWVTKCWNERTRGGWFGSSVKQQDTGVGKMYNY
ncbi:hypothetical protein L211DRAFT_832861 [Terfezia boudieri ATCC MYA-4762]|uniref:Uncharacterized protein n=1 Tax=Terfezia boudieri ATCC MYA-4762 TaxID=1051890 RepID=A0A3N4M1D1_9PEZI|nr:hypothetical protein L211DRAFT_844284 [Terfezia boudieri ATCC MYA-4762]RPB28976.1 hypothetical protein L211DRAFT_832861 [Terfezia boudieri ATCC MYA-4762]